MTVMVRKEDELFQNAAELIYTRAAQAVGERGKFSIVLAGGSTPKRLYSMLARDYEGTFPWQGTHIFFGDERCVPPTDPQSNFGMVEETLLRAVLIPPGNIHRIYGELSPSAAAERYSRDIVAFFGLKNGELPRFDLILLGMGEDGHTASIFPDSYVVHETRKLVAAPFVEKFVAYRVTLTPPVIQNAREILVLVTGERKAAALQHVLEGDYDPDLYPAQLLRRALGPVVWLVDPPAARSLPQ
jgi:6-phosphogluconolactonase